MRRGLRGEDRGVFHFSMVRAVLAPLPLLLAALLLQGCAEAPDPPDPPDRIFVNARVWTGDAGTPQANALAIQGDRILAVGSDDEIRTLAEPSTRIEDLAGRRVLPGLHDAHMHLPTRRTADLVGASGVEEMVERLRAFAGQFPDEAWITGRGWTPDLFPDQTPHRRYLDEAFPDRPVLITDRDGHLALANERALELAEVTPETRQPPGGEIERDGEGELTGVLKEGPAMGLVRRMLPSPSADEAYAVLLDEMERFASLGLTSLQMANAPSEPLAAALERAHARDALLQRFRVTVPFSAEADDADLTRYRELRDGHTGPFLRYGIAKGMLDGTVDGGTAAMLEPYARAEGTGLPMWEAETLDRAVARYDSAGIQVQLHAIGDRAIRMALDAFEYADQVNGGEERRHRVEHLEVPAPEDLSRFAELGVIASTQAIFATPDQTALTNYAPMLGPERAARSMPFRALDEAGALQVFGSDYPVFPIEPLLGIYAAVTRQLPDGTPEGGWHAEQRISLEAALRHYTWGAAYAAFREHELGTLAPGMLADLVVLSDEILGEPPASLLRTRVLLTVMGGRDTWRDPSMR